jgi:hypothetical protein
MSKKIVYNTITEAIRYLTNPDEEGLLKVQPLTLSMVLADAVPNTPDFAPGDFERNSYLTELVLRKVDSALQYPEFANDIRCVFDTVADDDHAVELLKLLKRRFR